MKLLFLIVVVLILLFSIKKRPGIFLSYMLFGQELNSLMFDGLGLFPYRYAVIFILFPIFFYVNRKYFNISTQLSFLMSRKITWGYLLLTCYVILYVLWIREKYEIDYLFMFLIPGFFIFFIGGLFVCQQRIIKEFFWGVILFSVLTFSFIVIFKNFAIGTVIDRVDMGLIIGISAISQGRIAGLLLLFAFLLIALKSKKMIILGTLLFIFGAYWLSVTGTRGPLVGLLITTFVYLLITTERKKQFITILILGSLIAVVLFQIGFFQSLLITRSEQLLQPDTIENTRRYERWLIFFDLIDSKLLLGFGPGAWGKYIMIGLYRYPHNMFIEFVVDYGIIGVVSFLLIYIYSLKKIYNLVRNRYVDIYLRAMLLTWLYYAVNCMFSGSLIQGNSIFFAVTGIVAGLHTTFLRQHFRAFDLNFNKYTFKLRPY